MARGEDELLLCRQRAESEAEERGPGQIMYSSMFTNVSLLSRLARSTPSGTMEHRASCQFQFQSQSQSHRTRRCSLH
jgi:hypothetical protein